MAQTVLFDDAEAQPLTRLRLRPTSDMGALAAVGAAV